MLYLIFTPNFCFFISDFHWGFRVWLFLCFCAVSREKKDRKGIYIKISRLWDMLFCLASTFHPYPLFNSILVLNNFHSLYVFTNNSIKGRHETRKRSWTVVVDFFCVLRGWKGISSSLLFVFVVICITTSHQHLANL
jgi:hypothetical protein